MISLRKLSRFVPVVILAAGALQAGLVLAQQKADSTTGENSGEQIRTDRTANLSPEEQKTEARNIVQQIDSLRGQISNLLEKARRDKDVVRINCLDDKLTQTNVTLREATDHKELLDTAISLNNDRQRTHEFGLMAIFRLRATSLDGEARKCVGDDPAVFARATTVEVTPNPNVSSAQQTEFREPTVVPDRPGLTSPIMM